jgi:broad specificity phosphatase PhoE
MESKTELMPKSDFYREIVKNNNNSVSSKNNYEILAGANLNNQTVNPSLNCVLFTHNTALRCFVSKIIMENGLPYAKLPRFKNCAIIRVSLNLETKSFSLELVYDGELSQDEIDGGKLSPNRPYYTKEQRITALGGVSDNYIVFYPIQGTIEDDNKHLNLLPSDLDDLSKKYNVKEVNIYEVRHGEGEHNDVSNFMSATLHMKKDTSITSEGVIQAMNSAKALKNILGDNKIHTMYSSDLKRTRETSSPFFDILVDPLIEKREIVVLPCSEELSNFGENCYEKSAKSIKIVRENYPDCRPETCKSFKTMRNYTIKINWSFYSAFYRNKMRGKTNLTDSPNCKDTTAVAMIVFELLNNDDKIRDSFSNNYEPLSYSFSNDDLQHISIGGAKTKKRRHKILFKNNLYKWNTRSARNNKSKMNKKMNLRTKTKMKTVKKQRMYKK